MEVHTSGHISVSMGYKFLTYGTRKMFFFHITKIQLTITVFTLDIPLWFFLLWRCNPTRVMASSFLRFSRSHNDAAQSVGLLWTSDQLVAETSTRQHTQHSQQTDIHAPGGIRTHDLSRRAAADLRLRPRGHWDWHIKQLLAQNLILKRYLLYSLDLMNHIFHASPFNTVIKQKSYNCKLLTYIF